MYYYGISIGNRRNSKRKRSSMAQFSRGIDAEDRIVTLLQGYGCQIFRNPLTNHENKVDFTIVQLPELSKLLPEPIGVQVTLKLGDREKRSQFLDRVVKNPYAPRNIYIELAPGLDLEKGGAFLVLVAITHFLSSSSFKEIKVIGVQIKADLTYEFQNIVAAAALQPPVVKVSSLEPGQLSGIIEWYDPVKCFGFIRTEGDVKYFFHRNDTRLKLESFLSSLEKEISSNEENPMKVAFVNSGRTPGKTYCQAKDVHQIQIQ
jgi:hypothetical protein